VAGAETRGIPVSLVWIEAPVPLTPIPRRKYGPRQPPCQDDRPDLYQQVDICTNDCLNLRVAGQAASVDGALQALSDSTRRRILARIRDHPLAVGEVALQLGISQQVASHHLRVLRGAGLVTEQRERTRHLFLVRTDGLAAVREFLDGFWPVQLAGLKRAAEADARRHRARRSTDA
jgi:DNA-binding transcriptional ArsR family regulator